MKKQEILDIAKQLILIAWKYSKVKNQNEKEKILKIFSDYEKELNKDNTKYSKTILWFLIDLKDDLLSGRELNIDNLKTDEYLENYLLITRELRYYNSLILEENYRIIFDELNKKKINNKIIEENLEEIRKNYISQIKKLNSKLIAQNLLIFTSFDRKIPKKYLLNLYLHLKTKKQKNIVLNLIAIWTKVIDEVKQYGVEFYKTNKFNYKYIWYTNINWKSVLNDKIVDCSKINYRTWFTKEEYLKLLKSL